jgi:hypothetical protein
MRAFRFARGHDLAPAGNRHDVGSGRRRCVEIEQRAPRERVADISDVSAVVSFDHLSAGVVMAGDHAHRNAIQQHANYAGVSERVG